MNETGYMLAGIPGALRTILIILLVYYGIRLLMRYLMPYILKKSANKMEDQFRNMQDQSNAQRRPRRNEGEVTIEFPKDKKRGNKPEDGEFADFEELD